MSFLILLLIAGFASFGFSSEQAIASSSVNGEASVGLPRVVGQMGHWPRCGCRLVDLAGLERSSTWS